MGRPKIVIGLYGPLFLIGLKQCCVVDLKIPSMCAHLETHEKNRLRYMLVLHTLLPLLPSRIFEKSLVQQKKQVVGEHHPKT